MRNLVWTFWLALILAIIGTFISSAILINQWNNYMYYSEIEGRPNYPLFELSKEIENTLKNQGNLEDLLLKNPISKFGDIYLIDSSGLDVLRRTLPEEIVIKPNSQPITKQPKFTQTIKLDTGETFFLIFSFDLEQRPIWNLFKRFGLLWIFFLAFIISGLISWWLASKTVRPIQKIALVSRLHGEGDLHAQIDKEILERKDEIGLLARQLKTSGIKIEELIKKQKDFLRDVSHEVRTPLARMQIAVETLELDTSDEKSMSQIKNEVLILDQLVQDLLHLSHFDHPSKKHKIDTITVYNLVHQCVDRSKILARSKNISIKVLDKNWENIKINGIIFLLERAIDNILSNALRHSPEYGEIEVTCEIEKSYCSVCIYDQGEGVTEESLKDIFEPFVRMDTSRNRQTGGFGLGLSLVKRIIEFHGGQVSASNYSNGFVVKLKIPLNINALELSLNNS